MSIEVRQCSQCQAAAAVCIRDWAITTYGIPSGKSTRDFCCQQCGHQFTLVSQHQILAYGVLSAIFLIACVGIIPGAYTAYLVSLWVRNPVVPNAPPPVMRFRGSALPLRLCTKCQGSARCTDVVRRRSGTTYTYVCMTCSKSFDIESVGSIFFLALAATIVPLIGLATLMGGVGVICLLMALFGYVSAALGIWRLFANRSCRSRPRSRRRWHQADAALRFAKNNEGHRLSRTRVAGAAKEDTQRDAHRLPLAPWLRGSVPHPSSASSCARRLDTRCRA